MLLKKIFAVSSICFLLMMQTASAEELDNYFYNIGKQLSSVQQKIYFFNKSISVNPLFKPAYDDLASVYISMGNNIQAELVNSAYKSELEKHKTESVKPDADKKVAENKKKYITNKSESENLKIEKITQNKKNREAVNSNKTHIQHDSSENNCGELIDADNCGNEINESDNCKKIDDCDKESLKENNENTEKKSYVKPVVYGLTGLTAIGAAGYYGFEKYKDYKKSQFIKKAVIYSSTAIAVGTAAYFIYKHYFSSEPKDPELDKKINDYINKIPQVNVMPQNNKETSSNIPIPPFQNDIQEAIPVPPLPEQSSAAVQEPYQFQQEPIPAPELIPMPEAVPAQESIPVPPVPSDISPDQQKNFNFPVYNLKTITLEQLLKIPGCDNVTAELIDRYKTYLMSEKKQQGFNSIDELYNIPLINPLKINLIKQYLYIE